MTDAGPGVRGGSFDDDVAGFHLTGLSEAEPEATLLSEHPEELARRRRVPLHLVLGARRA